MVHPRLKHHIIMQYLYSIYVVFMQYLVKSILYTPKYYAYTSLGKRPTHKFLPWYMYRHQYHKQTNKQTRQDSSPGIFNNSFNVIHPKKVTHFMAEHWHRLYRTRQISRTRSVSNRWWRNLTVHRLWQVSAADVSHWWMLVYPLRILLPALPWECY